MSPRLAPAQISTNLYKYYPPNRAEFLQNRLVCYSKISQLNDPFEGVSIAKSVFPESGPSSLRQQVDEVDLETEIYQAAIRHGECAETAAVMAKTASSNSQFLTELREHLFQTVTTYAANLPLNNAIMEQTLDAEYGVFCLSATPTSAPMWAHYAHNYRGYVVEFDSSHSFFKQKGLMGLRPITYGTRTVNNWLELENRDFLATKSDEWKYEQEWRAMRPLKEVDIVSNGHHLFEVPRDAILAIITCEQTDPTVVAMADSACAANGWSVKRLIVDKLQKKLLVNV